MSIYIGYIGRMIKRVVVGLVAIATILTLTMTATVIATVTATMPAAAANPPDIQVHRDRACNCCGRWMDHLTEQGFQPENIIEPDMDALKQAYGVPEALTSCHTAVVDGYLVEGHVPAADIKRLLAEQPNIAGIAAPGMPMGSPGMESGDDHDDFTVFSFDAQGHTEVFSQHSF